MTFVSFVNEKLAIETILAQLFILSAIAYLLFFRKKHNYVINFIRKYALLFAFLISLVATLGSLFYSQIAGFTPCELCWLQRIFMYPLVILLGLALIKKDSHITDYALSLSVIGGLISLYHNYMYYYNSGLNVFCILGGKGTSCIKRYVFEFGYVTIPLMAFTAFSLIIIFLIFQKMGSKKS